MKILVINTVKFHTNGMSNVIIDFYQNMNREDISFDFVINEKIEKRYSNIIQKNGDHYCILHKRNQNPLFYISQLTALLEKENYDIIHIHGNSALMSIELRAVQKSRTNAKVIVHVHNTNCTHPMLNKILSGYFSKHYDYAAACSDAAGKWLFPNSPYKVLNNGIDEQRFRYRPEIREKVRKEYHLEDKLVITHVGRFNKQKNHAFLMDVFEEIYRRNPNSVLRLIGTGELQQSVKERIRNTRIENAVIFVGVTDKPEIEYQIADVFVLPSIYESFGLVNVEAQCAGLPCVISDTVPKEIKIMEHVSFLSLERSPAEWAKVILSYARIPRESHHEDVIKHHYSIKHESQELRNFYLNISKRKKER